MGNPTPDIGYDPAGLRQAARQHSGVQASCADLSRTLGRATVAADAFGRVDAAAGFSTALDQVRTGQSQGCDDEARRRGELSTQAAHTATLGDGLTEDTTTAAGSGAPGAGPHGPR